MADDDRDRVSILRDLVYGESVESIARARGLMIAEVERILDEEAARQLGARELRRGLCLEKMRLEALLRKHFAAAIEGDTTCAVLYVKTSERLSSMLGTNAPIGHAVHVTASLPEADNGTSTTRLIEAIQRLKAEHQAKPDDDEEPPDKLN